MKIATITCNNAENYGARLQAFALYRYLADQGHEVSVIDYSPEYMRFATRLWFRPGLSVKDWGRLLLQHRQRRRQISKHHRLDDFSRKFTELTPVRYSGIDHLRANPPQADLYIAGSDQIWNTEFPNGTDPAFYLDFGSESTRRASYAASFATPAIAPDKVDAVKRLLGGIDDISVRESSALALAANLGRDAAQVCDPVWLLDPERWRTEIADGSGAGEKYLLVYDFMRSDALAAAVKRIARLRALKIYTVSPFPARYADRNYCDCNVSTFVGLINNAACVVSNSLHGSLFAMLLGRDFYVIDRPDGLNIRMSDLLRRYGLADRLISADSPDSALTSHIDYESVSPLMQADIAASREWLDKITRNPRP